LGWYENLETLLFQMDQFGVDKAVMIQIRGQANNTYQEECARKHPDRLSSVVVVDTARPDAIETLATLQEHGAVGLRLWADTRSPGADPLAIWKAAGGLGMPVSCGGDLESFASDDFAELVRRVPGTTIIIEHLGSVNHPDQESRPWRLRRKIWTLSRFPNTVMKIHGLGEFCRRAMPVKEPFPFDEPIPPFLDEVLTHYGPSRMMWGSDYPPVSSREGYGNSLKLPMARFAGLSQHERDAIFGGTAARVFGV
jgi:L-fuconolactonase